MLNLKNKTILVCGASSGIGRETAILCSRLGASLIISGRNPDKLEETYRSLQGEQHIMIVADLLKIEEINNLVNESPMLDGMVYSAGVTSHMPVQFINQGHLDSLMKINFEAAVHLNTGLLNKKKYKSGSSIVFISSIATKLAYFGGAIYSASKAALEAYSKTLSLELSSKKIRSNVICPTFVKTKMVDETERTISTESMDKMKSLHPLGFGEPIDVANAVAYFLSDEAKWISGTRLEMGGI